MHGCNPGDYIHLLPMLSFTFILKQRGIAGEEERMKFWKNLLDDRGSSPSWFKGKFMPPQLAVYCTELQLVPTQLEAKSDWLTLQLLAWNVAATFEGWGRRACFEIRVYVKDESLQVVGTFVELPDFLIAACLIMQNNGNHLAADIFPAVCSILQDLFGFHQIHQTLFWPITADLGNSRLVQAACHSDEFF